MSNSAVVKRRLSAVDLRGIVDLGRWAPSADNDQPWRVTPTSDGCDIHLRYQPKFSDLRGEASYLALGAFIETCRLAAAARLGVALSPVLHDVGSVTVGAPIRCATLTLVPDEPLDPSAPVLAEQITRRVTNRRLYAPLGCSHRELQAIDEAVHVIPDVQMHFVPQHRLGCLVRAVGVAERVRFLHEVCHRELHQWIRWTPEQCRRDPTGFSVQTFELKRHERMTLRLTRRYQALRAFHALFRAADVAATYARRQLRATGTVGLLCVDRRSPQHLMRAGMAMQRAWLQATALGLSVHPLAALPFFMRRLALGAEGFSRQQIRDVHLAQTLLTDLPDGVSAENILLIMRFGLAARPSAKTRRLPAEALIDRASS